MMRSPESLTIGRVLGLTAFIATVTIMPSSSYDPINVPKLLVISVGGFMALGALIANRTSLLQSRYRAVLLFSIAFAVDLVVVLAVSGTSFTKEFFGAFGRATGFIAYASLTALLLAAAVTASALNLYRFLGVLLLAGFASVVYGIIQILDLDPVDWVSSYSPVFGFLGNPNFQSSFIGITAVAAFSMLMSQQMKLITRTAFLVYIGSVIYVIKETQSQQGFLVVAGGLAIVGLMWVYRSRFKILTIPSVLISIAGFIFVTIGTLNKGPLSFLYKESVTFRGDYWRAGWKMTVEHPFFGVGLDSYGDWYRRARTIDATLRRGPNVTSDSAHNVLMDISSNGGFPLLFIYLFMLALVLVSAFKVMRRNKAFDPVFTALFAAWISFQAQSIISLNQLGLVVWGWIISGLIIGYEINTRDTATVTEEKSGKNQKVVKAVRERLQPVTVVGIFLGFVVGFAMAVPALNTDIKFKSALETNDALTIQNATLSWPQDPSRSAQVAVLFLDSKLPAQALVIIEDAKERFPDSFDVWRVLRAIPNISAEDLAEATAQMKRLDPTDPDLK